jgi:hypothetical protein
MSRADFHSLSYPINTSIGRAMYYHCPECNIKIKIHDPSPGLDATCPSCQKQMDFQETHMTPYGRIMIHFCPDCNFKVENCDPPAYFHASCPVCKKSMNILLKCPWCCNEISFTRNEFEICNEDEVQCPRCFGYFPA